MYYETQISRLDASENQGDATSTTSDSSEHGISEAIHIETGLEHGSTTTSSVTGSGDDRDNSSDSSSAGKKMRRLYLVMIRARKQVQPLKRHIPKKRNLRTTVSQLKQRTPEEILPVE